MRPRALILPLLAVLASAALLASYVHAGGSEYVPQRSADPCRAGLGPRITPKLEPLAERVVLVALNETACDLGVSRERLVLALPERADRRALARERGTDEAGLERALKRGLRRSVTRLDRARRLPKTSALVPEVLAASDLPGPVESLAERIPDSTIDSVLPAGALLRRVVDRLDVGALIDGIGTGENLESRLRDTVEAAVRDEVRQRVRDEIPDGIEDRLPGRLRDLLGD